ncbi:MAG: TIGR00296 family protein [Candidatus Aenigmarchaeota archaeon]|nr:TIGR00296 family protein [Candidatus Aenigmarchaeota archaeon]
MEDFIIKLARQTIENYVKTGKQIPIPENCPKELNEKRGIFVTIYKKSTKQLRGCIGIPYPEMSLVEALIQAAVSACLDPRFQPLRAEELEDIFIEISVLTNPEPVKTSDFEKEIEIGKHGLIIRKGLQGGLFLPKVPVEQKWNMEEYLENLCYKAGLTADSWLDSNSKLFKFEAQVFEEKL